MPEPPVLEDRQRCRETVASRPKASSTLASAAGPAAASDPPRHPRNLTGAGREALRRLGLIRSAATGPMPGHGAATVDPVTGRQSDDLFERRQPSGPAPGRGPYTVYTLAGGTSSGRTNGPLDRCRSVGEVRCAQTVYGAAANWASMSSRRSGVDRCRSPHGRRRPPRIKLQGGRVDPAEVLHLRRAPMASPGPHRRDPSRRRRVPGSARSRWLAPRRLTSLWSLAA